MIKITRKYLVLFNLFILFLASFNLQINARNISFKTAEEVIDYVKAQIKLEKKRESFNKNEAIRNICKELHLSSPPEKMHRKTIEKLIREKALEATDKKFNKELSEKINREATKKYPSLKPGDKITVEVVFYNVHYTTQKKISGKINKITTKHITIDGKTFPIKNLSRQSRSLVNGQISLRTNYFRQHFTSKRNDYLMEQNGKYKKKFRKEYDLSRTFYKKLKNAEKDYYNHLKHDLLKSNITSYLKQKYSVYQHAEDDMEKLKKLESLLKDYDTFMNAQPDLIEEIANSIFNIDEVRNRLLPKLKMKSMQDEITQVPTALKVNLEYLKEKPKNLTK